MEAEMKAQGSYVICSRSQPVSLKAREEKLKFPDLLECLFAWLPQVPVWWALTGERGRQDEVGAHQHLGLSRGKCLVEP